MFESSSTSQSSRIMRTKFGKFRVIRFAIKSLTAGAMFLRKKENREIISPLGKYYLEREKKRRKPDLIWCRHSNSSLPDRGRRTFVSRGHARHSQYRSRSIEQRSVNNRPDPLSRVRFFFTVSPTSPWNGMIY